MSSVTERKLFFCFSCYVIVSWFEIVTTFIRTNEKLVEMLGNGSVQRRKEFLMKSLKSFLEKLRHLNV